jgi:hypothetical protein
MHGRDRNLYGRHAAIGLAEYKLNVGCVPYAAPNAEFREVSEVPRDEDVVVFVGSKPREKITAAILFRRRGSGRPQLPYAGLFAQPAVRVTVES